MCGKSFAFWYFAVLFFIASSSKSQQNSTSNEEKIDNLMIQYELDTNSTINYGDKMQTMSHNFYKKFNDIPDMIYDDMQYESRIISTNNDDEDHDLIQYKRLDARSKRQNHEDDKQMSIESHTNSIKNSTSQKIYTNLLKIGDKNFTSHEFFEDSNKVSTRDKSHIVLYEMCYNIICIQFCCPLGDRFVDDECVSEKSEYYFPNVYEYANDSLHENKRVDKFFQLAVYDPCKENDRFLIPDGYQYDYMIFSNGSIYLSYYKIFVKPTSYCLAIVEGNKFEVTICKDIFDEVNSTITNNTSSINEVQIIYVSFHIVSILFLMLIFLVYSILPELRNVHGFMLCNYSGALFIAYIIDIVNVLIKADTIQYSICVTIAFFNYFCFLTSFFWLNMMSFDMWWTFRGFCSLQRNAKRLQERSKLMFYVIYAWGLPFIFAVICIIMDFVSEKLPKILRPEFREGKCWFYEKEAFALYYYGLKSICIISSVCLSISTAFKISRYEKDTSNRLTDSESMRYNNNKKWFNLYLKLFIVLFIVMGIKWCIMTASWLSQIISNYISYVVNLMDIVQNMCTFIIFVWKKKIKLLLLKRFGCSLFPSTRCTTNAA